MSASQQKSDELIQKLERRLLKITELLNQGETAKAQLLINEFDTEQKARYAIWILKRIPDQPVAQKWLKQFQKKYENKGKTKVVVKSESRSLLRKIILVVLSALLLIFGSLVAVNLITKQRAGQVSGLPLTKKIIVDVTDLYQLSFNLPDNYSYNTTQSSPQALAYAYFQPQRSDYGAGQGGNLLVYEKGSEGIKGISTFEEIPSLLQDRGNLTEEPSNSINKLNAKVFTTLNAENIHNLFVVIETPTTFIFVTGQDKLPDDIVRAISDTIEVSFSQSATSNMPVSETLNVEFGTNWQNILLSQSLVFQSLDGDILNIRYPANWIAIDDGRGFLGFANSQETYAQAEATSGIANYHPVENQVVGYLTARHFNGGLAEAVSSTFSNQQQTNLIINKHDAILGVGTRSSADGALAAGVIGIELTSGAIATLYFWAPPNQQSLFENELRAMAETILEENNIPILSTAEDKSVIPTIQPEMTSDGYSSTATQSIESVELSGGNTVLTQTVTTEFNGKFRVTFGLPEGWTYDEFDVDQDGGKGVTFSQHEVPLCQNSTECGSIVTIIKGWKGINDL